MRTGFIYTACNDPVNTVAVTPDDHLMLSGAKSCLQDFARFNLSTGGWCADRRQQAQVWRCSRLRARIIARLLTRPPPLGLRFWDRPKSGGPLGLAANPCMAANRSMASLAAADHGSQCTLRLPKRKGARRMSQT